MFGGEVSHDLLRRSHFLSLAHHERPLLLGRSMITDHEKFKNVLSGVQSIVLSVAVLVGGIWTTVTFRLLHTTTKAEADLEELNRKLKQQAIVQINIQAS